MSQSGSGARRAAFLDRDGVINIDHGYVFRREDFIFVPGVLEGARRLHQLGFALVVITNQSGIGRGLYSVSDFEELDGLDEGTVRRRQRTAGRGVLLSPSPDRGSGRISASLRVSQASARHVARGGTRTRPESRNISAVR